MTAFNYGLLTYLIIGLVIAAAMYTGIRLTDRARRDPDSPNDVRQAAAELDNKIRNTPMVLLLTVLILMWPACLVLFVRDRRR